MIVLADIGPATGALEAAATAIGAGIVVVGFGLTSLRRLIHTFSGAGWRDEALSDGFWGGVWGMFCLCIDAAIGYLG